MFQRRKTMKKTFSKAFAVLAAAALTASSLAGCGKDPVVEDTTAATTAASGGSETGGSETGESTAESGASASGTFTYAIGGDPTESVNVITTSDRWGLSTVKMIYSPLYMNNADGINWFLATDYSVSDDGMTYTFTLRDDVV